MLKRQRRSAERGQTLILAIAFLAMFGLLAAAVLGFASGVQTQRGLTENTAAADSVAEGSAQFAIADTGIQGCGTVTSGTMKFASGDVLAYTAGASACTHTSSTIPGQGCGLCVLNFNNVATPIDVLKGNWTVPGEIDVNGSIKAQSICSGTCPPSNGLIGLFGSGATCSSCSPAKVALANKVLDPLAGTLPIPTPGPNLGSKSGNTIICPGTYTNLNVANNDILYLSAYGQNGCAASTAPSVYIVTGQVSNTGGGNLVAGGVTLYMTPSASMNFSGNNTSQISIDCGATPTNANCGTANPPSTGPYAGIAVFFDPANTSSIVFQGNGNFTVAGTFEASHTILSMGGNGGTQSFESGRLIVSEIQGNGNGGAGLGFGGTVNAAGCNYWTDALSGKLASGATRTAHVRFETACNAGSPTSIIGFAYG